MLKLTITIMLVACTSRQGPDLAVVFDQSSIDAGRIASTVQGASAWQNLDVRYTDSPSAPECALDWYAHPSSLPCTITIHVSFYPKSELAGAAGLTDHGARQTMLAYELQGGQLVSIAAHEFGHSLWNTSAHLAPDEHGIMQNPSGGYEWPTSDDESYVAAHAEGW